MTPNRDIACYDLPVCGVLSLVPPLHDFAHAWKFEASLGYLRTQAECVGALKTS